MSYLSKEELVNSLREWICYNTEGMLLQAIKTLDNATLQNYIERVSGAKLDISERRDREFLVPCVFHSIKVSLESGRSASRLEKDLAKFTREDLSTLINAYESIYHKSSYMYYR